MKLARSLRHVIFNSFSKRSKDGFYDKKIFPNDLTLRFSEKIISTQSTAFNSSAFAPFFTLLCATKATPLKKLCYFKLAIVKTRNWLSAIRNKMEGNEATEQQADIFSLFLFHSYYRPFILSNKSSIPSLWSLYSPSPLPYSPPRPFLHCSWERSYRYGYWKLIAKEWWTFNQSRAEQSANFSHLHLFFITFLHLDVVLSFFSDKYKRNEA